MWYALRAAPSREFKAERLMKRMGLRVILPREYRQRKRYKGRRCPGEDKPIERPLYGNWLLVQFRHGFAHNFIRRLRDRGYLIGYAADTEGDPKRISDADIINIRRNGLKAQIMTPIEDIPFKVGQKVKIVDGPFHGFEMEVETVREDTASGTFDILGKPATVTFTHAQLEAAE